MIYQFTNDYKLYQSKVWDDICVIIKKIMKKLPSTYLNV